MESSRSKNAKSPARPSEPTTKRDLQFSIPQKQQKTGVQMDKDDRTKMKDIEMKKNNRVFDYVHKLKKQNEASKMISNTLKHFQSANSMLQQITLRQMDIDNQQHNMNINKSNLQTPINSMTNIERQQQHSSKKVNHTFGNNLNIPNNIENQQQQFYMEDQSSTRKSSRTLNKIQNQYTFNYLSSQQQNSNSNRIIEQFSNIVDSSQRVCKQIIPDIKQLQKFHKQVENKFKNQNLQSKPYTQNQDYIAKKEEFLNQLYPEMKQQNNQAEFNKFMGFKSFQDQSKSTMQDQKEQRFLFLQRQEKLKQIDQLYEKKRQELMDEKLQQEKQRMMKIQKKEQKIKKQKSQMLYQQYQQQQQEMLKEMQISKGQSQTSQVSPRKFNASISQFNNSQQSQDQIYENEQKNDNNNQNIKIYETQDKEFQYEKQVLKNRLSEVQLRSDYNSTKIQDTEETLITTGRTKSASNIGFYSNLLGSKMDGDSKFSSGENMYFVSQNKFLSQQGKQSQLNKISQEQVHSPFHNKKQKKASQDSTIYEQSQKSILLNKSGSKILDNQKQQSTKKKQLTIDIDLTKIPRSGNSITNLNTAKKLQSPKTIPQIQLPLTQRGSQLTISERESFKNSRTTSFNNLGGGESSSRRNYKNSFMKKNSKFFLHKENDLRNMEDVRITKAKHLVEHCYNIRDKSEMQEDKRLQIMTVEPPKLKQKVLEIQKQQQFLKAFQIKSPLAVNKDGLKKQFQNSDQNDSKQESYNDLDFPEIPQEYNINNSSDQNNPENYNRIENFDQQNDQSKQLNIENFIESQSSYISDESENLETEGKFYDLDIEQQEEIEKINKQFQQKLMTLTCKKKYATISTEYNQFQHLKIKKKKKKRRKRKKKGIDKFNDELEKVYKEKYAQLKQEQEIYAWQQKQMENDPVKNHRNTIIETNKEKIFSDRGDSQALFMKRQHKWQNIVEDLKKENVVQKGQLKQFRKNFNKQIKPLYKKFNEDMKDHTKNPSLYQLMKQYEQNQNNNIIKTNTISNNNQSKMGNSKMSEQLEILEQQYLQSIQSQEQEYANMVVSKEYNNLGNGVKIPKLQNLQNLNMNAKSQTERQQLQMLSSKNSKQKLNTQNE